MTEKTSPSFKVDIHMAFDINSAGLIIQRYAAETGLCVTLTPQSFIYTGGREEGFKVGFINYPRFPKAPGEILARVRDLASVLRVQLGQHSYSIVTPSETIWVSHRPEDAPPPPQTKEAGSLLLKEASLPTTSRLSQLEARTSWTASGEPSTTLARDDEGEER